jgi:hypothetical protein
VGKKKGEEGNGEWGKGNMNEVYNGKRGEGKGERERERERRESKRRRNRGG